MSFDLAWWAANLQQDTAHCSLKLQHSAAATVIATYMQFTLPCKVLFVWHAA
jgi:hypothetical protein